MVALWMCTLCRTAESTQKANQKALHGQMKQQPDETATAPLTLFV
jgi:hypothetical protein